MNQIKGTENRLNLSNEKNSIVHAKDEAAKGNAQLFSGRNKMIN